MPVHPLQMLPRLNLPPIRPDRISVDPSGRAIIYDPLRCKNVALTPEEWVRQHFTTWLLSPGMDYPRSLVVNEVGLTLNGRQYRADTIIYDRRLRPLAVVEYKRPTVAVTQRVFDQIVSYNMTLQAPVVIVSNGLSHYCCRIDFASRSYSFLPAVPAYGELAPEV